MERMKNKYKELISKRYVVDEKDIERQIVALLNNGELCSEDDILSLINNYGIDEYTSYGDNGRWNRPVSNIISIDGCFYCITWYEGLTEMQDNFYPNQPVRVYPHKKIVHYETTYFDENKEDEDEN